MRHQVMAQQDRLRKAQELAQAAERQAAEAKAALEHPGVIQALADLELIYERQWLDSAPGAVTEREDAHVMLRAITHLRQNLAAKAQAGTVAAFNYRSTLAAAHKRK